MQVSCRWLKEWVDIDLDAEALADTLTMAGLEVDRVEPAGPPLDGVVVAEIVAVAAHPDADRLQVCTVDDGGAAPLNIVCGAPNARAGLKVPLAKIGAALPNGLKIKAAKLRGVASEGMLCSAVELGLGDDQAGLLELPAEAPVGQRLDAYLELDDHIIDIDLTPNRGDCLSVRGLARDIAAITGTRSAFPGDPLSPVVSTARQGENGGGVAISQVPPTSERSFPVELQAPADCARYVGRVIEAIDPTAASPRWLTERLRRSGIRPLSAVVDVTNYVLLELGQPLHAFDLDKLEGGIRVRRGTDGDRITLLDGQEITPRGEHLLIADHAGPVALAGVMGGADSAVGDATRNIFLESAWFNPAVIVGKARELGMATESAHRFERGVDPELQVPAIERATALILAVAGGRPGPVINVTDRAHLPAPVPIELRLSRVNALLGSDLDTDTVRGILESLEMRVEDATTAAAGVVFKVTPPSARADLALEVDLIEEVARIYGYNRLPETAPGGRLRAGVPGERALPEMVLHNHVVARGFYQAITWSFVADSLLQRFGLADGCQPLANPLSRDMGVLRTALTPGLVQTAAGNLRRQQSRVRLFETGHCFIAGADGLTEPQRLGLVMAGTADPEHWSDPRRPVDFFDLKGDVEHLLELSGGGAEFRPTDRAWLHPGQAAEVIRDGEILGWIGQLHPNVATAMDIGQDVFLAELDLEQLLKRPLPEYCITPRFPAVRRDLSLLVPEKVACNEVVMVARELSGACLREVVVFDQYQGKGVEDGYKSLAIGLIFQDLSRTLKDQEVDSLVTRVTYGLGDRLNAKLRG